MTGNTALDIAFLIGVGAGAQWLAWRMNVPAILPLLTAGFLLGPLLGLFDPSEVIDEALLFPAISLAVGLILFEGGLTLKIPEVRDVRRVVFNLITLGVVVTWFGATAAAYYLTDLGMALSFLFGALVVVTGPTVIGPLLRNVRPKLRVANVLRWEGMLIDPVGALLALLVFEFIEVGSTTQAVGEVASLFLSFVAVGVFTGAVAGAFMTWLLLRHKLPDYLINVVALALVFLTFAISNAVAEESGLLATTVMGMVMANLRAPGIDSILDFKEDLSLLFISLLFVELAADIELAAFVAAIDWRSILLLLLLIVVVRPLSVFVSTMRSTLSWRERVFIAGTAPRGIVAAAVTSLFASKLTITGLGNADLLVPLVFLVIMTTVLLSSLVAKPLARYLNLAEPDPQGFLILGATPVAQQVAKALQQEDIHVLLTTTSWAEVADARMAGLNTYYGSPLSDRSDDELSLAGIGNLLALTPNDEANSLAALKFARLFGRKHIFQLGSKTPTRNHVSSEQRGRRIFYGGSTYEDLDHLIDCCAVVKRTRISDSFRLGHLVARYQGNYLPMFVISQQQGSKHVDVVTERNINPEPGSTLIALAVDVPALERNTPKKESAKHPLITPHDSSGEVTLEP